MDIPEAKVKVIKCPHCQGWIFLSERLDVEAIEVIQEEECISRTLMKECGCYPKEPVKKSCETCLISQLNAGHREVCPSGYDVICLKCFNYSKWRKAE